MFASLEVTKLWIC